jgi:GNAT superfamily N-acetyltransferase
MPTSPDTIMRIERTAVRAWPALETAAVQGWLWRYTGGGSQRANSVSPLAFAGSDVEAAIDAVEHLYRARGAGPMFQICDATEPPDLDERLARRGYRLQEPCTTLAKEIAAGAAMPAGLELAAAPDPDWLSVYFSGIGPNRKEHAPRILAGVPSPRAFLLLRHEGRPMSVALAVAANGVVIAECVATSADLRRHGGSRRVMQGVEAWGAAQGADVAALQAVAANAPAQALYAKLAYRRVAGYHYRVLDT